jgi:hypothetical protein
MVTKKKKTKKNDKIISGEEHDKLVGRMLISAPGSAAGTLSDIYKQADFLKTFHDVGEAISAVHNDSLKVAESMLVSQVYVLNSLFNAHASAEIKSRYIEEKEMHANIALRAQNQCNRTLKTLLEFKNPKRATFIKQQNNLQINEGDQEKEKKVSPANELLEVNHDARLDPGTPQEAVRGDTTLETVEKVDGTED